MNVLTIYNRSNADAVVAMTQIAAYLTSQEITNDAIDALDLKGSAPNNLDLIVVLGGDGTVLHAARYAQYTRTPILGMNYGHLGFIVNGREENVVAAVADALAGEVTQEARTNLHVDVCCEGDNQNEFETMVSKFQAPDDHRTFFALNEAALTHGDSGRVVDLQLHINGKPMTEVTGDGYVIASATGSTAYALSAGGPVISPDFKGLEAIPLAPHSLRTRALVTGFNDVVELRVMNSPAAQQAALFCDGVEAQFGAPVSRIVVRRGAEPTILLRRPGNDFYTRAQHTFL